MKLRADKCVTVCVTICLYFIASLNAAALAAGDGDKKAKKAPTSGKAEDLDGTAIFKQCAFKYPGDDQRSKFTVLLRDREGNIKRSEYLRFWKDFKGRDGISDKMLLFTVYPPDAAGSGFMRVAYDPKLKKNVDQWIYLPLLRKIRRVSIRDPGDSFLNSNLTYADVSNRTLEEDNHKFLGIKKVKDLEFYVVESTPKEADPQYSKRIFWFLKAAKPEDCVNTRIDYFDRKGELLKEQFVKWQRVGKAWVWDRVLVRSRRTLTASRFELSEVKVNTGLSDDIFTARTLYQGPQSIAGVPSTGQPSAGASAQEKSPTTTSPDKSPPSTVAPSADDSETAN